MELSYHFIDVEVKGLNQTACTNWIENMFLTEGLEPGMFNIIFCTDEYLYDMNMAYLKHDYYTDIITFDYSEDDTASGDLFISVDRVKDNAIEMNISFLDELYRVIIHGFLHLAAYKDKTDEDKQNMTAKENEYLSKLILTN